MATLPPELPSQTFPGGGGPGIPAGGTTGQVLEKNSSSNYDVSWQTPAAEPTSFYQQNIGDGVTTSITVTHNLNSYFIIALLKDNGTGNVINASYKCPSANTTTFSFDTAPVSNGVNVALLALNLA